MPGFSVRPFKRNLLRLHRPANLLRLPWDMKKTRSIRYLAWRNIDEANNRKPTGRLSWVAWKLDRLTQALLPRLNKLEFIICLFLIGNSIILTGKVLSFFFCTPFRRLHYRAIINWYIRRVFYMDCGVFTNPVDVANNIAVIKFVI